MTILCVHQGYELYGSDRTFINAVGEFREAFPGVEVSVLLPKAGPLSEHLTRNGFTVQIGGVMVLRRQHMLRFLATAPFLLVRELVTAWRAMRRADIVYVNTVVVLNFLLTARWHRCAIVHVHEIPSRRQIWLFRGLLSWSRASVLFNSRATARAYGLSQKRSAIVYNGTRAITEPSLARYDGSRPLRILMLGRLSRSKGQDLLLTALSALPDAVLRNISARIVGDAFEGRFSIDEMCKGAEWSRIADRVDFFPFSADPDEHYRWCDLVIVPSRRPESFGLVAIEGMAHGRAVVAAEHGGITEIVQASRTGWLFPPNAAPALAACLAEAVASPEMVRRFGHNANERFRATFQSEVTNEAFRKAVAAIVQAQHRFRPSENGAEVRTHSANPN